MTGAWSGLLVAALATPLLLVAACAFRPVRARVLDLLPLAPVPGLAAALLAAGAPSISWTLPRLRLTLALDLPGAVLLGTAALLWIGAGVYAAAHQRGQPHSTRFAEFWLLALAGSLGVFFAADLVSFYVLFALASLAPYGLIAHDGTPRARRAALIYVNFAVLGEALLLAGFVLLAAAIPGESLLIGDAVAALPGSATRTVTLICLIAGFGLKAGLVPLHVWLPLAYSAAPIPAAAVISGAISKAGIIGLIRFLPVMAGLPALGRRADRHWPVRGLLRCGGRSHAGQPEDRAGLFQYQPDGVHRGGAGPGAFGRERGRALARRLLRGPSRAGERVAVPRRGREPLGAVRAGSGWSCYLRPLSPWASAVCRSPAAASRSSP